MWWKTLIYAVYMHKWENIIQSITMIVSMIVMYNYAKWNYAFVMLKNVVLINCDIR